ncbi:MAG: EamA family transporter [Salibacteraceae bacterium]|nr:EamA family transporter [Salibacteraceae bacterium]
MFKKFIIDYRYQIALHATVFIWGFTGILGKLIEVPYYSIVWYRMLIAAFGIAMYAISTKAQLKISFKKALIFIFVGFIVAAHWSTFFQALKVSNVSVVLTTLASASLFVAILEPIFFKRKLILYELLFGLAVIVGLSLIFNFESQYALGILLALSSAFLAALFSTINGLLIRENKSRIITFYEMVGGVIGISIYTLLFESPTITDFSPGINDIIYLLILGLVCTAVAFVVSVEVMKELSPFTVSISINMEPIYAIVLALIFFGESEQMTPGFYLGALIIFSTVLGNSALKSIQKRRRKKKETQ